MNMNDMSFMEVIWNKLDQYKEAVIGKKSSNELKALRDSLMKELAETSKYDGQEIAQYFQDQCRNIEARYSFVGHPINN